MVEAVAAAVAQVAEVDVELPLTARKLALRPASMAELGGAAQRDAAAAAVVVVAAAERRTSSTDSRARPIASTGTRRC